MFGSPSLSLLLVLLWSVFAGVRAVPARGNGNGGGNQTPQQQAAQVPQGISQAADGSTILDMTATINNLPIRFRVSAPADQFTTASKVPGGTQAPGTAGAMGMNVLLHGDGGQSFFDYPNQVPQGNLMGVVVLAPSEQLLWGQHKGQPQGLSRVNGVEDAQAVNDLVQKVLPQMVAFNQSNVFFTGVSGGSLTLSGFFVPAHMANFAGTGVMFMCGGMAPQVPVNNAAAFIGNTKIHFQSTQGELSSLQQSIPQSIKAYEQLATAGGLSTAQVGALQTVDNTPPGGHCAFDGKAFSSGIQLISNNYQNIMQGGNGAVNGINTQTVLKPVPGNENLKFSGANRRDTGATWGRYSWMSGKEAM